MINVTIVVKTVEYKISIMMTVLILLYYVHLIMLILLLWLMFYFFLHLTVLSAGLGWLLLGGQLDVFVAIGAVTTILAIINYTLDSTVEIAVLMNS